MGRGLYERATTFRTCFDACADILQPLLGRDLRTLLFAGDQAADLTATRIAQPALFAVEYALAKVLQDYGIEPAAVVGHSVGEFVAACLAGVFSLEDALTLVAERGRLMQDLPAGAMLVVRAGESELGRLLERNLDIAALNAPRLAVVSGTLDAIEEMELRLAATGVSSRRLHASHAFHSAMMEPVLAPLSRRVAGKLLSPPSLPYVSGVTGTWIEDAEATSADYWARHCRVPVRFADALQTLVDGGVNVLLEVGPGATLSTFALQGAAKNGDAIVLRTLPGSEREIGDFEGLLETLGRLWIAGATPDWDALARGTVRSRVSLPTYPFERTRHWLEPNSSVAAPPRTESMHHHDVESGHVETTAASARARTELLALLEELSGERLADADPRATFLELGFDSLFLGRFVQQVQLRFGVSASFRQLLSDLPTIVALADHLAARMPARPVTEAVSTETGSRIPPRAPLASAPLPEAVEGLMREQLQALQGLLREQLQTLKAFGIESAAPALERAAPTLEPAAPAVEACRPAAASPAEAFGIAGAQKADVTPAQREHIDDLVARTVARTGESKRLTQRYRKVLADPRVAAGFRSEWKEMVYPITCVRAKGSRIWDADGNEYLDLLNGFGQTAFGHVPDFVVDAVSEQLRTGFAIGPQTQLAGEAAELFCELTGNERITFCNTGSEAVMAALRVARTVTNRDRVVIFEGAYHGQFDEVLVKGSRTSNRSLPVALGIPAEAVANITVLPYGADESLVWVREHRDELAAVVVESVQSRHPGLAPKDFLLELRRITEASGAALVFDEVVTGFRMHPGGMQAIFGIKADLATYGKVVGGGLPIGILAGKARFMDALDGGAWQYGDDSFPQVAPTFIAGTFVRHPLAMAAVLAVLQRVKAEGPKLQVALGRRTAGLVERLNAQLERRGIVSRIETYGSLFYLNFATEDRLASLLYYHLRLRGIYVQEGFPSFLGTEHDDADVDAIVAAFSESLDELQSAGVFVARAPALPVIVPRTDLASVALTEEQTEIWLSAQVGDDASCAFNESVTLRLRGSLDESSFQTAWERVIARHDALRAAFGTTGEMMHFASPSPRAYPRTDLSGGSTSQREADFCAIVAEDARTAFDLSNGPLVRGHLVRLTLDEHAFVFTAHHIVCDGWSMNVILSELAQTYSALSKQQEPQLPEALAFADYARRQAARDPEERAKVESYWLAQFEDLPTVLDLPTDRPRPATRTYRGATRTAFVGHDASRAIKQAGARHGCTLFVTLLAAFDVLVGRLADRDDVVVGVPAAGQALLGGDTLVGHCVDFLPIRARRTSETTLRDLLSSLKHQVIDAYEHQEYTLGTLVRSLAVQRENNRVPIAEIQFNLERLAEDLDFGPLQARVEPNPKAFVNFDLFLNVVESRDGLRLDCDYNADLFDASTIERWLGYFRTLLERIGQDASQPVAGVDFLPDDERQLLAGLNATAAAYPVAQTVHELFRASAAANPDAVAVRFGDETLTFAALERRVNQMANHLLERVGAGRRIAICVDRTPNLLVAMLATLAAGCSYLPLDTAHPVARLRRILDDAGVAALIDDGTADAAIASGTVERIDVSEAAQALGAASSQAPAVARSGDDAAYVIYTSGSTGEPKGVEIAHRSVVNLLTSMSRTPGFGRDDLLLAVTTVSFDIAALELFLPLVVGATVAIASREETSDAFALARRARALGATAMQATPALWQLLLAAGFQSHAGFTMICGGETLTRELANRLLAGGGTLWNVYGPTETTIWSSCGKIEIGDEPIAVGTPIANTQFYVLDRRDRPVPIGAPGHLNVAGDGVARGYVNRAQLSAEKFVANPFGNGRMYRTGDRARIARDGRVQILGRLDRQVKLRGFRIELAEIETVVQKEGGLAEVAVVLREDRGGEPRLAAYYVDREEPGRTPAELRALAAAHLPDFMIPSVWTKLERMPLSVAGKVDRSLLPAPEPTADSDRFRAAVTPTELLLARVWADVLHLERVGLDDDFFALGGDSIQLFQITARANRAGLRLAAKELLRHPTIAALALRLDELARTSDKRRSDVPSASVARLRPTQQPERAGLRRAAEQRSP
ncbi:MAG: amino acid adenylation domain-containing protein [Candidatus Baltobacteraceae bacterium]